MRRRALQIGLLLGCTAAGLVTPTVQAREAAGAADARLDRVHFLIPAGPGGGLDNTGRAFGKAMVDTGVVAQASFENMTGGGGGRAMGHFIQTASRQHGTLLVNSSPLLVRSLQGLFAHAWGDLVPVAGLINEWSALVVRADSPITSFDMLIAALRDDPRRYNVGGGSVRGSFDHIAAVLMLQSAGIEPQALRYLPYDGGGKALLALLGGEAQVLATGAGEVLNYVQSGHVRVLAVSAPARHPGLPDTPTLTELEVPVVFGNWRGLFAAPGTPTAQVQALQDAVVAAARSPGWQQALTRHGWEAQLLEGDAFARYLTGQEAQLRAIMAELGFIQ